MKDFFTIILNGTDYSKRLKDFNTKSSTIALTTADFLYIGFRKPFKQLFIELQEKSVEGGVLTAQYYDGSTWQPLNTLIDETYNFTESGFLFFDKPTSWKTFSDTGIPENFYIRLVTSVDHTLTTEITGIGVLLSNDFDLIGVRSNIVEKHNSGNSWVVKHEQARKDILQMINNVGNRKVVNADNTNPLVTEGIRFADITEFDLLEPTQLRQASLYKVLSMIYLDELSDDIEDKWFRQGTRYESKAAKMVDTFRLQIDFDDDGIEDLEENRETTSTDLVWT